LFGTLLLGGFMTYQELQIRRGLEFWRLGFSEDYILVECGAEVLEYVKQL
jgi:hypothetical protein